MTIQTRDLQQQNQAKLNTKKDLEPIIRAVIQEIDGSVWANQSERRVWYLPNGATQPGQVLCIRGGVRPQANLPVLVGKAEGSDVLEVLSVDPLVMVQQSNLPPQVADHAREHEPRGRDVMNLYGRQIVPLQAYYTGSGLLINIVSGWYDYKGTLKRFKGRTNFNLESNQPASGNVVKVGIYIDADNVLDTVDGSSVLDTVTNIPEPIWPSGAFPLCVVKLNGTQATISYDDIQDRRAIYGLSDIHTFPLAGKINIDFVEYDTLAEANTAAVTGNLIHLGEGTFSTNAITLKAATYKGQGIDVTTVNTDTQLTTGSLLTLANDTILENMTINLDCNGAAGVFRNDGNTVTIRNCKITGLQAGSSLIIGLQTLSGGATRLDNVEIETDGGANFSHALWVTGSSTINAYNCVFNGVSSGGYQSGGLPYSQDVFVFDDTSVINLHDCQLKNNTLIRRNDFGPSNIIQSWEAEPIAQNNPIINGGFNIWQRGTSFVAIANNTVTADRFRYFKSGTMVHTVSRATDVPAVAEASKLANYSLLIDCTTADTSIGAFDYSAFRTVIEGYNWLDFAQQGFWLSFWVKATKAGTYCISLENFGQNRQFVAEYTIHTSDIWEYKEIYIPASPSGGTWNYTNNVGLIINWALACGSFWQTTSWNWNSNSGFYLATSNQVNACDSTANNFQIWGIMMSKHRSPFTQPSHQQELERAQRYYWQTLGTSGSASAAFGRAYSTTAARLLLPTPVEMRATPTITPGAGALLIGNGGAFTVRSVTTYGAAPNGIICDAFVTSGLVANQLYHFYSLGGTNTTMDTEL